MSAGSGLAWLGHGRHDDDAVGGTAMGMVHWHEGLFLQPHHLQTMQCDVTDQAAPGASAVVGVSVWRGGAPPVDGLCSRTCWCGSTGCGR